jgi:hypothetical protein
MMRNFYLLAFLLLTVPGFGQNQQKSITVNYIDEILKVDGIMDEPAWETAGSADRFWQYFPTDSALAKHATEIRMVYNGNTLYVGIRADVIGDNYVVTNLRRDFSGGGNDNITLMFDTFNDGTNAFLFGLNPYGVQREGLVSGGGAERESLNSTWDVKWQAESRTYEDHYIMEIAIPFSSLKFREGESKWRFQAYRFDFQGNERSAWARIPQNQIMLNLAFMGEMVFEKPLGKSRTPIAIIPYVNAGLAKNYVSGQAFKDLGFGGDAKVAIGNGMNLDLTLNPDFSNVEADPIFTNLTRFEISLPERRQFFVDNSDLFASFGSSRDAIPFFSRRIGIARDTTNTYIENRIIGGVRLSGKLNQDWRLGFLNIQTEEDLPNKIPSNNNMMLALQKRVFARSNIGFFLVNRQSFGKYEFLENEDTYDQYNRVLGVDYNLASIDNTWSGKFYLHKSLQPDDKKGNYSSQALLIYNTRFYRVISDFVYVDQDFQSDLGFIPRTDVFKTGHAVERIFWPQSRILNRHSFQLFALNFWRPNLDFKKTDHDYRFSWRADLKDQSNFRLDYSNKFIFLTRDFDPTRSREGVPLPGNKGYYFNQVSAEYQSNRANVLAYEIESTIGEFYNGNSFSFEGNLNLRLQPWAAIGLALNYDQIRLPDPHPDADLWLLSPAIDVTFSRSLFWSTLVQYSNQRDNLGLNSRLQWRYAPLSDLYLVYNDNYFVNHFSPRSRSVNLKLTYWLNI